MPHESVSKEATTGEHVVVHSSCRNLLRIAIALAKRWRVAIMRPIGTARVGWMTNAWMHDTKIIGAAAAPSFFLSCKVLDIKMSRGRRRSSSGEKQEAAVARHQGQGCVIQYAPNKTVHRAEGTRKGAEDNAPQQWREGEKG